MSTDSVRNENFTLMIVGGAHQQVRRVQIARRRVAAIVATVSVLLALFGTGAIHYMTILDQGLVTRTLRAENAAISARLSTLAKKTDNLEAQLSKVNTVDKDIRGLADLPARPRELAVGPLRNPAGAAGGGASEIEPFAVPLADNGEPIVNVDLIEGRLDLLHQETERSAQSLSDLVGFFTARASLLAKTPSVWPTRGWITSVFGWRDDPFRGGQTMHAGIDLAAAEGTQVVAPAAGVVVAAGENGGYGRFIALDHGRGIVTHYGHMSRLLVKIGDEVTRGHHIGAVGNTGRSTGPHLHYEVRVNGIPMNPRSYVLEW